ncbi:hypothetical protein TNCV_2283471 [Trichonephila clavipes]|nr:hypothetical protein TNCV_2283471 [Trichonephila clavipes]
MCALVSRNGLSINVRCKFRRCNKSKPPGAKSLKRLYEMSKEISSVKDLPRSGRSWDHVVLKASEMKSFHAHGSGNLFSLPSYANSIMGMGVMLQERYNSPALVKAEM